MSLTLSHLQTLEAESIHIIREVAAEFERPVMLYSIGKDSSVMLRLAQKAFAPGKIPFPLLHIDTSYKFKEMIEFRDHYPKSIGCDLRVYTNQEAVDAGASPTQLGTAKCCIEIPVRQTVQQCPGFEQGAALLGSQLKWVRSVIERLAVRPN